MLSLIGVRKTRGKILNFLKNGHKIWIFQEIVIYLYRNIELKQDCYEFRRLFNSCRVMSDKEFLEWIYNRMINVHHENPNVDYMLKFREILTKNRKEL